MSESRTALTTNMNDISKKTLRSLAPDPTPLQHKKDLSASPHNAQPDSSSGATSSYSSASSSSASSESSSYSQLDVKSDGDKLGMSSAIIDHKVGFKRPDIATYLINRLPQDLLIEIFSWHQYPQILRLVNRAFHRVSQFTSTKALWLLRHYPYYKVLEKSMRWIFFDVAVAKTMFSLNPDIFCSRFYVRKAILKLDKEKYRFKSSKKVLQHFVLLTGKQYFGLDPEDDSEFPLQKATGDDRAMTEAIRSRQWNVVEHIGSVNGYGFWVHTPFARQNLNSMLLDARNIAQSIEVPQPPTDVTSNAEDIARSGSASHTLNNNNSQDVSSPQDSKRNMARHNVRKTAILPQSFLRALRTCLRTMCSSYSPQYSRQTSPYSDKYLVKLALQTELISVYSLVIEKLGPYLSSKDKENIVDSMSFEGVTTDETFIRIIRDYKFPIQYGKWNEKPLFALAWHNMSHRIHLLLELGFDPRYVLPSSDENNFMHDLLCAENTSLELYFMLLDAGIPLELSTLKKIVESTVFEGILLGWIIKNWSHINSRVEWSVLQDLMVAYSSDSPILILPSAKRPAQHSLIDWQRKEEEEGRTLQREFEMAVLSELEEGRHNEENAYADDEGAGFSSPGGDEVSREDEDEGVDVDDDAEAEEAEPLSSDEEHEQAADWRNMPLEGLQYMR
ncbi:hypothetical protein BC943DRAFT_328765 [Umbelopsis sp. AD052]|nr:hypothetical protein BC943DRAFT_328765 [Umbelopsis sp. AD052]